MRAALLALVLLAVLAASALNLALGALWALALAGITWLRSRVRHAAWLVLLLAVAAGAGAARLGWLAAPPAGSYDVDETARLGGRLGGLGARVGVGRDARPASFADAREAARQRVAARRREELGHTGRQLEQRAVAAIAVSRDVGRLRTRAPAEVSGLEDAVRQLALTLTAPEFRDLDAREARLLAWFAELDGRAAAARDQTDLDTIERALQPAALAAVSLRPLRDDLARVAAASDAVVRALTGGGVLVSEAVAYAYDDGPGVLTEERRITFEATPGLRLSRVDVGALREPPGPTLAAQTVTYAVDGSEPRPLTGTDVVPGGDGAARVLVVDRRARRRPAVPIGPVLRPLRFLRVTVPAALRDAREFPVRVRLPGEPDAEPALVLAPGAPRLLAVRLPRHALHHASRPGTVTTSDDADVWVPAEPGDPARPGGPMLAMELVPARPLLRTAAFARLRPYLYQPSLATALLLVALAASASVLARPRPRAPAPSAPSTPPTPTVGGR